MLVWQRLERAGAARPPFPIRGRIPNFKGSEGAAERLCSTREYRRAEVVFVNPDSPQLPIRERVIRDGKRLVMASPKLRRGFLLVDSVRRAREAATIRGALSAGKSVHPRDFQVDLVVEGSVAVDLMGARLGKGGGFGDLEFAILKEAGAISNTVPIATTVHDLQIVDSIPVEPHDAPVELIATPSRLIEIRQPPPKPPGVLWETVRPEQLRKIPLLQGLKKRGGPGGI